MARGIKPRVDWHPREVVATHSARGGGGGAGRARVDVEGDPYAIGGEAGEDPADA